MYLEGQLLKNIARQLTVSPASVANWLKSYDVHGVDGLKTRVSPGPKSKLTDAQKERLDEIIKNGAKAAWVSLQRLDRKNARRINRAKIRSEVQFDPYPLVAPFSRVFIAAPSKKVGKSRLG